VKYFLEIWLKGYARDRLKELSSNTANPYHPHITLVRPFTIPRDESRVRRLIEGICKETDPIYFKLMGRGNFPKGVNYIPIIEEGNLLEFSERLEKSLEKHVIFSPKIEESKTLHATLNLDTLPPVCEEIEQYMLWLTAMRNGLIWFSYDFVNKISLDRNETLNHNRWLQTVNDFSIRYGLIPTRGGFRRIRR